MDRGKLSTPVNFVLFQICWFGSVLGAANRIGWVGPFLVLMAIPPQIFWFTKEYKAEASFIVLCGLLGFCLETILIGFGVYVPVGKGNLPVCPPWMVGLWVNFGMLVSLSLSWLKGKYLLAFILGGFAGPLAWWGGEKLGALIVAAEFIKGYIPLGFVWAAVLPALIYLHSRLVVTEEAEKSKFFPDHF